MSEAISSEQLSKFHQLIEDDSKSRVLERAVSKNGILATSADFHSEVNMDPVFSIDLDTGDVANQKQSGRCWMFAALNTMRHDLKNRFGVAKDFELSQSYTFFWDKLEKSNYFYENVIKTASLPTSDRKVAWLMTTPQQDGGQWDMITAIIRKYGVVPKSVMPESYNSSKSNLTGGSPNV